MRMSRSPQNGGFHRCTGGGPLPAAARAAPRWHPNQAELLRLLRHGSAVAAIAHRLSPYRHICPAFAMVCLELPHANGSLPIRDRDRGGLSSRSQSLRFPPRKPAFDRKAEAQRAFRPRVRANDGRYAQRQDRTDGKCVMSSRLTDSERPLLRRGGWPECCIFGSTPDAAPVDSRIGRRAR